MLEVTKITVGEMEFQITPMPLMEQAKYNLKVMRLVAPLISALDGLQKDEDAPAKSKDAPTEVQFDKVAGAIGTALEVFSDEEAEAFYVGMLKRVQRVDGQVIELSSIGGINRAFEGTGPTDLYRLLFEVAKFNKFTPFVLAGAGSPIGGILGSFVPPAAKKTGLSLARLGA